LWIRVIDHPLAERLPPARLAARRIIHNPDANAFRLLSNQYSYASIRVIEWAR